MSNQASSGGGATYPNIKQLWHNLLSRLARPMVERAFAAGYAAGKQASRYEELPY